MTARHKYDANPKELPVSRLHALSVRSMALSLT